MGVFESFQPIYSFEDSSEGQGKQVHWCEFFLVPNDCVTRNILYDCSGYYRVGLIIAFAMFIAWVMSQPTDFDTFVEGQKTFVDDLYSGNLLTDFSQASKDRMDR